MKYSEEAVGKLDQFAKEVFAEETPTITRGGAAWQAPSEINLSEVRLEGMLLTSSASGSKPASLPNG
jgi:hypothetical protein